MTPTVLSISSHVVAGRVGMSVTSFAFTRLGISVWPLPTVLYPATPRPGGPAGANVPQEIFELLLAGVEQDGALGRLAALHIGYLRTPAQVAVVARVIARLRRANPTALICLDPILGDEPGGLYIPADTAAAIAAQLVSAADILTPNLFELGTLAGSPIHTESEALAAARALKARLVVVTSAPSAPAHAATLLVEPERAFRFTTPRVTQAPHGTGDLLTALFLARLLKGEAAPDALASAVASVDNMITAAIAAGRDDLPIVELQERLADPAARAVREEIR